MPKIGNCSEMASQCFECQVSQPVYIERENLLTPELSNESIYNFAQSLVGNFFSKRARHDEAFPD